MRSVLMFRDLSLSSSLSLHSQELVKGRNKSSPQFLPTPNQDYGVGLLAVLVEAIHRQDCICLIPSVSICG
jgi:hypothetical protein